MKKSPALYLSSHTTIYNNYAVFVHQLMLNQAWKHE